MELNGISARGVQDGDHVTGTHAQASFRPENADDSDISVIAYGVTQEPEETPECLIRKAQNIIDALGNGVGTNVCIQKVVRFKTRVAGKPGLVKITLSKPDEKVLVLRSKWSLKNSRDYTEVFLQSCRSRAERVIVQNARAVLRQLPDGGKNFRVDGNGRIVPRRARDVNSEPMEQHID
jgi:hypothetical protein